MEQFDTWFLQHTYSHSVAIMATLANVVATGEPARFPELHMVFIEAGVSWVGHLLARLDWAWHERPDDLPDFSDPPSVILRGRAFYATQPIEEPEHLSQMVSVIRAFGGQESVVFASDYPHHDFDHPRKVWDIPLDEQTRRNIMGGNAVRALRLPAGVATSAR